MPLYLLIASVVILLCVLLNKLTLKAGVPVLLAFIALGMLFGVDGLFKIYFEDYHLSEHICTVALIFIMFYGGFGTSWPQARPIAGKAAMLSSLGVVCTAGLTGLFCMFILRMELWESFLVGAVISSTDAASVFSVLRSKKLGLRENTASLLEMESGSNDPFSYMLTITLLSMMNGTMSGWNAVYLLFSQLFFGALLGACIALGARWLLRRFPITAAGFDMAFVVGAAVLAYALPSMIGGNGYLSVYIVGLVLGNTKMKTKPSMVHFFDGLTGLMQMLIFFLLGLLATPSRILPVLVPSVLIALFVTFIARPATVFACLTPFRSSVRQQLLVSFAGLRGAASIVFAILATVSDTALGYDLFHIVFCIVLLSISFQGALLAPVARRLQMCDRSVDDAKSFSDYTEEAALSFVKLHMVSGHPWVGKTIAKLSLPPDLLIVMLLRNGSRLIPSGKTQLLAGDDVVISAPACVEDGGIVLSEQKIPAGSSWIGRPISEFSPYPEELVIMILREGRTVIPNGETIIAQGDLLVIGSV